MNKIRPAILTTLTILVNLYANNAVAKSDCRQLSSETFMNSDLSPIYLDNNHREESQKQIQDFLATVKDGETFCKIIVKSLKTGKISASQTRTKTENQLKDAYKKYEIDGDMDALETEKAIAKIASGAINIADK